MQQLIKHLLFYFVLTFPTYVQSQEHVFGVGTNFTISSSFSSGSITPYAFYQNKKHHLGIGPMKGQQLNATIIYFENVGLGSFNMQLGPGKGITGLQIHYRYYLYEPNKVFDVFLEGQLTSTHIKFTKNGEKYKSGLFFNTMSGLGFKLKFAKRFALSQTSLVGIQSMYLPHIEDFDNFEKLFWSSNKRISFTITLGLEIQLFK